MNELEDILSRLGAELEKPLPAVEVPTVEAEGTSEDQMVRVSVTGGQVSGIVIDRLVIYAPKPYSKPCLPKTSKPTAAEECGAYSPHADCA